MVFPFSLPYVNYYGKGAIAGLANELEKKQPKKVFLISDRVLKDAGIVDLVLQQMAGFEVVEYLDVEKEPSVENVEAATEQFKNAGCEAIVAVGGGSPIDVAKGVSVLATNEGSILDYVGVQLVPNPGVYKVLIPTTAGTGAEVTQNAIFTDRKAQLKKGVVSQYLIPDVAIVDPDLTMSCPPFITASTGMDALTHAIESFTAPKATMQTDMYALKAIELISEHLRTAVGYGKNKEAREGMAMASVFAGISLANAGVGGVHALAYPLGGQYGVPHGVANAVLLPYVLEFNILGNLKKFRQVAEAMGENTAGMKDRDAAFLALDAVRQLSQDVGIPQTLTELGVTEDSLGSLAEGAMQAARLIDNNPRLIKLDDVKQIFSRAL
ncbi:iron-containing alcohol dehydrogenase [Dethiobacter alkaliphilus]|uniref:iron-containing alcohol dehydrogenase n=1 Tax=Dethiobacter alkaliphilus TaxID=427926 RepID=UPI0022278CC0|nr:iron-containing alcohol dehydrogenase [Dethiobacter alkaliphilus]MCW3489414.1 iron-containing alcohol dehydrogenase [Dethiobacter alkaliphilus]